MTTVVVVVAVFLLLVFFQRKNMSRLLTSLKGQFGKLSRAAVAIDPVAVYQEQVDEGAAEIAHATQGLEQYRGLVAQLQRQVVANKKEAVVLEARAKSYLVANDETKAAEMAVQLQRVQKELVDHEEKLQEYDAAYQNNLKKIKYARQKIDDARDKARKLDAELKMSKAEAETSKLAQSFNVKNDKLSGLNEIEDEIQRQIDVNRSKSQVARDLSTDGIAEIEEEEKLQKQEAQAVLDRLRQEISK